MNREAYKRRAKRAKRRAARHARRVLFVPGIGHWRGQIVQGYRENSSLPETGLITMRLAGGDEKFAAAREHEGVSWVQGWYGEVADAFRAQVALRRG